MRFSVRNRRNWRRSLRKVHAVLLNGQDVTWRCQIADARLRRVYLLDLDKDGHPFVNRDTMEVSGRWQYGRVTIVLRRKKPVAPVR